MYISTSFVRLIFLSVLLLTSSCGDSQNRARRTNRKPLTLDETIEMNKIQVGNEQAYISAFVKENDLNMQRTETGLWYEVSNDSIEAPVISDKIVILDYEVSLLDGTICYSSDETGYKEFLVGKGGVESGLEEGILMLRKGSEATFILPSHLAHGLMGDDDKIPSRAILKYKIKVIDIKDK